MSNDIVKRHSKIAHMYYNKVMNATTRGIPFTISLLSFMNLMRTKYCRYTGIPLTLPKGKTRETDRTLERIDPTKGYEPGNVIVVCYAANSLKANVDDPNRLLKIKHFIKMAKKLEKFTKDLDKKRR